MTPYDVHAFRRSLVLGSTLCLLVWGVMAATDGAQTAPAAKLGQLFTLTPLLAALGALIADSQAQARGETRALASLGVSPSRAGLGASIAVALLGLSGAAALALGWGDIDGLLPRLDGTSWIHQPGGAWGSADLAIRVDAAGEPSLHEVGAIRVESQAPTGPIVASVVWMTLVLADWTTERAGGWARLVAALAGGGVAVVLFHLLAAGRISGWALLAVPLPLLAQTWGLRARRWTHETRSSGDR
jgi:hypothetical protein